MTVPSTVLLDTLASLAPTALPDLDEAAATLRVMSPPPGAAIFRQDAADGRLHAVRTGLVKLAYLGEDGSEWIKSFVAEGKVFASLAALAPGGRTSFEATTLEPSAVESVDHAVLAHLATRHLVWSQVLQRLVMAHAARKETRERELLTLSAEARYRRFLAEEPALARRVQQKDLARHLGVTPVGLNRIVRRVRAGD